MKSLLLILALGAGFAHAEDKTCQLGGMHCEDCAQMVRAKVCDGDKYSTCDVKVTDETKEIGQMHLITKDKKATIDEKALDAIVKDQGYTLNKCTAKKPGKA